MPEVDRAHVGAPAQEVLAPLVEVAIHGREHHADAALTIAEILLRPHHGVVGGGLHRFAEWARGALRNGIEDTDSLSARQPARQLRGSVDRGGRRRARLAVVELGRAPDAPRVKQPLAVAVHLAAIHIKAEDARALDEKWPSFLKERLECREVEHRGILLHLPEVGVHGRIEREVRRDSVLQVGTAGDFLRPIEGAAGGNGHVLGQHIWRDFRPAR